MTEEKKNLPLDQVVDPNNFRMLLQQVIQTREGVADGRSFTYKEVKYPYNDKVICVMGRHVPLEEVFKNGKSSCNVCIGKGYYVQEISKKQLPDPSEYLVQEDGLPKDLTPIEQKKWEEAEKTKPNWRIISVCLCAVKAAHKKNLSYLSNNTHNIWMVLDYEIKDA